MKTVKVTEETLRRIQEVMVTLKAQEDVKRLSMIFTDLIRQI